MCRASHGRRLTTEEDVIDKNDAVTGTPHGSTGEGPSGALEKTEDALEQK